MSAYWHDESSSSVVGTGKDPFGIHLVKRNVKSEKTEKTGARARETVGRKMMAPEERVRVNSWNERKSSLLGRERREEETDSLIPI